MRDRLRPRIRRCTTKAPCERIIGPLLDDPIEIVDGGFVVVLEVSDSACPKRIEVFGSESQRFAERFDGVRVSIESEQSLTASVMSGGVVRRLIEYFIEHAERVLEFTIAEVFVSLLRRRVHTVPPGGMG